MENLIKEPAVKYNWTSANDYLAFEMESEERHEYFDGEIVKMQGASLQHEDVVSNIVGEVTAQLKGKPCRVRASNLKVAPPGYRSFMYPDATITCGNPELRREYGDILLNPVVVFEVLSKSTEGLDFSKKLLYYRQIPTLEAYVLINSYSAYTVHVFTRQPNNIWMLETLQNLTDTLVLPSVGVALPLAVIYENIAEEPQTEGEKIENMVEEPALKYNYLSANDFLVFDMAADERHEYFDGEIVKMQGASLQHEDVVSNLVRHAGNALGEKPCRVRASNLKVAPPGFRSFMYPDATITCGKPELRRDYGDILLNPVVVFEVLSKSTEGLDFSKKLLYYRQIPTLEAYVLINSYSAYTVHVFTRQPNNIWMLETLQNLTDTLVLPSVGVALPLAAIYENITVEPENDDDNIADG
jgi:Uma2 family endonuclease